MRSLVHTMNASDTTNQLNALAAHLYGRANTSSPNALVTNSSDTSSGRRMTRLLQALKPYSNQWTTDFRLRTLRSSPEPLTQHNDHPQPNAGRESPAQHLPWPIPHD